MGSNFGLTLPKLEPLLHASCNGGRQRQTVSETVSVVIVIMGVLVAQLGEDPRWEIAGPFQPLAEFAGAPSTFNGSTFFELGDLGCGCRMDGVFVVEDFRTM